MCFVLFIFVVLCENKRQRVHVYFILSPLTQLHPFTNVESYIYIGQERDLEIIQTPQFDEYGFMIKPEFKHHNYTELEQVLLDLNETYPNITDLRSAGVSVQGRKLYYMVLGNTPLKHLPGRTKGMFSFKSLNNTAYR